MDPRGHSICSLLLQIVQQRSVQSQKRINAPTHLTQTIIPPYHRSNVNKGRERARSSVASYSRCECCRPLHVVVGLNMCTGVWVCVFGVGLRICSHMFRYYSCTQLRDIKKMWIRACLMPPKLQAFANEVQVKTRAPLLHLSTRESTAKQAARVDACAAIQFCSTIAEGRSCHEF